MMKTAFIICCLVLYVLNFRNLFGSILILYGVFGAINSIRVCILHGREMMLDCDNVVELIIEGIVHMILWPMRDEYE